MQNTNIIPVGAAHEIDDLEAIIGHPQYIIAEGNLVAYYSAKENAGTVYSIGVAVCPTRTDYPLLDVDSKSVGTYQKSPKNQFMKKGTVISPGGTSDLNGATLPTAVYDPRTKKFFVYYIGKITVGPVYNICLASGYSYDSLTKYDKVIDVSTIPTASSLGLVQPQVVFDKEENLFKLYYVCFVTASPTLISTYVATSKNGYDF
jgi:hypothetical protein